MAVDPVGKIFHDEGAAVRAIARKIATDCVAAALNRSIRYGVCIVDFVYQVT